MYGSGNVFSNFSLVLKHNRSEKILSKGGIYWRCYTKRPTRLSTPHSHFGYGRRYLHFRGWKRQLLKSDLSGRYISLDLSLLEIDREIILRHKSIHFIFLFVWIFSPYFVFSKFYCLEYWITNSITANIYICIYYITRHVISLFLTILPFMAFSKNPL